VSGQWRPCFRRFFGAQWLLVWNKDVLYNQATCAIPAQEPHKSWGRRAPVIRTVTGVLLAADHNLRHAWKRRQHQGVATLTC
jgi:hypothetical protein